jgi:hypothetical protein
MRGLERGCVVLDQPQHVRIASCGVGSSVFGFLKPLRLVKTTQPRSFGCGTAALRCIAELPACRAMTNLNSWKLATPCRLEICATTVHPGLPLAQPIAATLDFVGDPAEGPLGRFGRSLDLT